MAKELDWKSSKAATPRGFESHVPRQKTQKQALSLLLCFLQKCAGLEPTGG